MNEFGKARVTLFGWYVLISLFLLSAFTVVAIGAERQSFSKIESMLSDRVQRPVLSEVLERRLLKFSADFSERLLYFDIVLFFLATGASWFLSGKTLKPIEEMVKKQEEFSADASHELRTPLTSIIMEIEALNRTQKKIPKDISISLANIKEESLRMKNLVNNLLTLVRTRTIGSPANESFSINKAAKSTFKSLEKLALKKHLQFTYEETAILQMTGSEEAIKQLLVILLDNAIKFTSAGFVKMRISKEGPRAKVEIADTGVGIPSKDIPYIFERFYRINARINLQGSGLGLAIAKKIVDEHKGNITVKSKPDEGSVFTVSFPAAS